MINFNSKHIAIICAGTLLEVFDSYVFVFFMPEISANFLQFGNHSQMLSLVAFAITFIARPISGVIWGILGDRVGKSWVFRNAMLFMAIVTMLIGLLPTYDQIGIAAAVLLFILRIAQGISISGELSSAIVLCYEQSKPEQRVKNHSLLYTFIFTGFVLANIATLTFKNIPSLSFAWRLPFICGGVLGILVYCIRRRIQFPERLHKVNIFDLFSQHLKPILFSILANCLVTLNWFYFISSNTMLPRNQIHSPFTSLFCSLIGTLSCFVAGQFLCKQWTRFQQILLITMATAILHIVILALLYLGHNPQYLLIFYYLEAAIAGIVFIVVPLLIIEASAESYRNSIYTIAVNTSTALIVGGLPIILNAVIDFKNINLYLLLMGLLVLNLCTLAMLWLSNNKGYRRQTTQFASFPASRE